MAAFFVLVCAVPHTYAAYCPGDSRNQEQLFYCPSGSGIAVADSISLNHVYHETCFGSMEAWVFTNSGCSGDKSE